MSVLFQAMLILVMKRLTTAATCHHNIIFVL
jgi:hypothetical protein